MTDNPFPTVTLDEPIKRGETEIQAVQLRRPKSGELRGLSMIDIVQLKVDAVQDILPRITMPPLTALEVEEICPADFFKLSTEIAGFFIPKETLPSLGT